MDKTKDPREYLTLFALGKYKDLRPASWRHRPRRLLDGGPDARWGTRPRMSLIDGKVSASPRPTMQHVYPHEGAQWLLIERVRQETEGGHSLSTWVPKKTRFALLDERREETQGGLTGGHDGVNRAYKTVGLKKFDLLPDYVASASGIYKGERRYPLIRPAVDPAEEVATAQIIARAEAIRDSVSPPTARKRIPELGEGLTRDESSYWREPAGGVYLNPWYWRANARGHYIGHPALLKHLSGAWDEYPDIGAVWTAERIATEYPDGLPSVPTDRREWKAGDGWAAGKNAADERELPAVEREKPLRFESVARREHSKATAKSRFGLLPWTDEQRATCARGKWGALV
jgi:hypothetical protein